MMMIIGGYYQGDENIFLFNIFVKVTNTPHTPPTPLLLFGGIFLLPSSQPNIFSPHSPAWVEEHFLLLLFISF